MSVRMGVLRVVLVAAGVAIGVLLLLLAHDVRSSETALGDETLAATAHPANRVSLTPPTILPAAVSRWSLGTERDREWLEAIQKFALAYQETENQDALGPAAYGLLDDGQKALGKVTQDRDAARASQAYDLLAVLVFRRAYPGSGVDPGLVGDALIDLQNALRLDPGNETAKENLELALRVAVAVHAAVKKASSTGNARSNKRQGGEGGPPGAGY